MTTEFKFWANVNKDTPNGCWMWISGISKYGSLSIKRKKILVHRFSYELHHPLSSPIVDIPYVVCHKCDNTRCVNPNHLWLGTQKNNVHDSINKGRFINPPHKIGDNHASSILKAEQVLEIRELWATGHYKLIELAKTYNVSASCIKGIVYRNNWNHI